LGAIEKRAILTAVREAGNDKNLAARMLGIGKTTLYRKLKEYGCDAPSTLASSDTVSSPQRTIPNAPAENGTVTDSAQLESIEKTAILSAMAEAENDRQLVAQMLGIGRTTLYRRLKEYGVPRSHCSRTKAARKMQSNSSTARQLEAPK
jgi:DNA-binding NtrC family response regulator